jgi:undecaprenyl-diphosphatase
MILIQAFLQIILESLPISSSGHSALVEKIMGWQALSQECDYMLHGPTLILLGIYFRKSWIPLLLHAWRFRKLVGRMIVVVCCADLVTTVVYFLVKTFFPTFSLSCGFLITALSLYSLRFQNWSIYQEMTLKKALVIGFVQGCAALQGVSRLATTFVAGTWLGLSARKSFLVSCMLQAPLIGAGFLSGLVRGDARCAELFSSLSSLLILAVAMVIAYAALYSVQHAMERKTVWRYAYYMIIPLLVSCLVG